MNICNSLCELLLGLALIFHTPNQHEQDKSCQKMLQRSVCIVCTLPLSSTCMPILYYYLHNCVTHVVFNLWTHSVTMWNYDGAKRMNLWLVHKIMLVAVPCGYMFKIWVLAINVVLHLILWSYVTNVQKTNTSFSSRKEDNSS